MSHRPIPNLTDRQIRRFNGLIAVDPQTSCWVFQKVATRERLKNYGLFNANGAGWKAHRIAYLLATGVDPQQSLVCHKCDNPPCVNPDHLFLGTPRDNAQDSIAKGRRPYRRPSPEAILRRRLAANTTRCQVGICKRCGHIRTDDYHSQGIARCRACQKTRDALKHAHRQLSRLDNDGIRICVRCGHRRTDDMPNGRGTRCRACWVNRTKTLSKI